MHHRTLKLAILLALTTAASASFADPDHTYLEKDGIVLFNVEDAEPVEGWELRTTLGGFRGDGYLEWRGPNYFSGGTAGNGNVTYHFRITTAGNYQLRLRNYLAEGTSSTEHNDSWVRLATGVNIPDEQPLNGWTKVYSNTANQWSWSSNTVDHGGFPVRQYFAVGDHTVEISGRSRGHAIDMITLYHYDEVNYNTSTVNSWELSDVVTGDGTITTPGEYPDPDDNGSNPDIPLVNLEIADASWNELESNTCVGNTLALSAIDSAYFNPNDGNLTYNRDAELPITNNEAIALLHFDTTLVPPYNDVILEYSTTSAAANANLDYSLASHNQWSTSAEDGNSAPDAPYAMLQLGAASGGWQANKRYQSTLSPNFVTSTSNTVMMHAQANSDTLAIHSHTDTEQPPRLLLSGDNNFCNDWQANIDAAAEPTEEEDTDTETGDDTSDEDNTETGDDTSDEDNTDTGDDTSDEDNTDTGDDTSNEDNSDTGDDTSDEDNSDTGDDTSDEDNSNTGDDTSNEDNSDTGDDTSDEDNSDTGDDTSDEDNSNTGDDTSDEDNTDGESDQGGVVDETSDEENTEGESTQSEAVDETSDENSENGEDTSGAETEPAVHNVGDSQTKDTNKEEGKSLASKLTGSMSTSGFFILILMTIGRLARRRSSRGC